VVAAALDKPPLPRGLIYLFKMKDIRFRAWDIFYKKFIYSDDKRSDLANFWAKVLGGIDAKRKVPVMQFIGLKDKNGKEIYEGDILERWGKGQADPFVVEPLIPVNRFYGMYPTPHGDDRMSWAEEYEVIGNIYENPKLLKS
jgi:YopX protein